MKLITALIFVLTYALLVWRNDHKAVFTWLAVLLLLGLGILSLSDAFGAINWNVIGLFAGTLIIADLFIFSRAPELFADLLIERAKSLGLAFLYVCILSSVISMFVENVATVLIVAPIALALAQKGKVSPIPALIGIAISSNLQGTATLVGDPPSMILGSFAHLNFMDFFVFQGRPGIFFAVQAGAIASFLVLMIFFKDFRQPVSLPQRAKVISWVPALILLAFILALAGQSFLPYEVPNGAAYVTLFFAAVGLTWFAGFHKKFKSAMEVMKQFDYETLFFLIGIFVLVSSLTKVGLISDLAGWLGVISGGNYLIAFLLVVWLSVFFSAFIDNVPYILAMLPVAALLAQGLNVQPYLLYFGLLVGASVGGNITPIGASANIVACGLLKRHKAPVCFGEFVRLGLPFTLAAVLFSSTFLWLVWR